MQLLMEYEKVDNDRDDFDTLISEESEGIRTPERLTRRTRSC